MSRFFAATRYLIIIPLPIAALGIFLGLRAWAARQERERHSMYRQENSDSASSEDNGSSG